MEVSLHITEQCNLNCKSCLHMIPIAKVPYWWYMEEYIRPNLKALKKHEKIVDKFILMGGEPTTHPHLSSILYITREELPNIPICLSTNGVDVKKFEDEVLIKSIQRNSIFIDVSEYPYSQNARVNYDHLYEIFESNNIEYSVDADMEMDSKFLTQPFRKEINNYILKPEECKAHHYCTMLKDCKLWVCHLAAYVDSLKYRFPELDWINIDEGAYVDLEDPDITDNMILEKMKSFSIICKHCIEPHRWWRSDEPGEMVDWGRSERKKEEWVRG